MSDDHWLFTFKSKAVRDVLEGLQAWVEFAEMDFMPVPYDWAISSDFHPPPLV